MITRVHIEPRTLRFQTPLVLNGSIHTARPSWLVWLEDSSGNIGVGEAAPWPPARCEFDEGSLQTALRWLDPWRDGLERLPQLRDPAVNFALETAWLDLRSKLHGLPLHKLLNLAASDSVAVNGLVGQITPDEAAREAERLSRTGYRGIKVKLGRRDFAADLEVLDRVCAYPWLAVRADCNGEWTREQAEERLPQLVRYNLQYVEEPTNGLASLEGLLGLGVPLAADESLPRELPQVFSLPQVVLKPSRLGGFRALREAIAWSHAKQAAVTVTGMFEGPVASAAILHASAAWLPPTAMCGIMPGLFTNGGPELRFAAGVFHLPGTPGLGFGKRHASSIGRCA